jgi:hypothetical protein
MDFRLFCQYIRETNDEMFNSLGIYTDLKKKYN